MKRRTSKHETENSKNDSCDFLSVVSGHNMVLFAVPDHSGCFRAYHERKFYLVLPALIHGRRASCHYICWMAPFMVIGSMLGRLLHFPQLHVGADRERCISCGQCSKACPMGLDVKNMVLKSGNAGHPECMQSGSYKDGYSGPGNRLKTSECIQCGACIDACPKKVLKYKCEGLKWKI